MTTRYRTKEIRARLTKDERESLEELTTLVGCSYTDVIRGNIKLLAPYLNVPGCKDLRYIKALRAAIINPCVLTFQLLDIERADIMQNEQDALMRHSLHNQGCTLNCMEPYEVIRDVTEEY